MRNYRRAAKIKVFELGLLSSLGFLSTLFWLSGTCVGAAREELIEGAKKEGEVVFYASMDIEQANALTAKFEERYPFLKVKLNRAGSEKLLTKVLTEARAKKYLVDAIQTVGFSMRTLGKQGILGYYLSPENRFYPKEFKEEGYWITARYNPYVVATNTKLVQRGSLPKNYEDLLNPQWRGKMMMEETKVDWFAGMLQIMGKEKGLKYMRDLARQDIMPRVGHNLISQLVATGEAQLAINIAAPAVEALTKKGAPIDWIALGPVPAIMIGIGMASKAPHPNAAKLFLDFVLSQEGQKQLQQHYPWLARAGFTQERAIKVVPVDPALAENINEYAKLMRDIFSR